MSSNTVPTSWAYSRPAARPIFRLLRHANGEVTLVDDRCAVVDALSACLERVRSSSRPLRALIEPLRPLLGAPLEVLAALPATSKPFYGGPLATEAYAALNCEPFALDPTSGSTGRPVMRIYRAVDDDVDLALTTQVLRASGLASDDTVVCLDVEAAPLHDFYLRAARLAGARRTAYVHLTADVGTSLAPLSRLSPGLLLSVPSVFARAWSTLTSLWPAGTCPVRSVLFIGESTPPLLRAHIRSAWGCRVTSFYGTTEAGGIGAECILGDGHHVDGATNILTVRAVAELDDTSVTGELLVTTPAQHTHPVIKYAVGDIVRISTAACPCGDPRPRLWILRRTQDTFVFAGIKISYDAILDSLRAVVPELDPPTVRVLDGPDGGPGILLRLLIHPRFASSATGLAEALQHDIHKLDALCRYGLVACEIVPDELAGTTRKLRRIVDLRSRTPN